MLFSPKWWNWYTQGTQNPPGPRAHAGSIPAFGTILCILLPILASSASPVVDRIVAVANGQIVAQTEVGEWMDLEPGLSKDEALQKIIREKLRLQDIARYAQYTVGDKDILDALAKAGLSGTPGTRRAFRRKLIVRQYIQERFVPLVFISESAVRDYLLATFPAITEADPLTPEWEPARKLLEARELERMITEWDAKLARAAQIRISSGSGE